MARWLMFISYIILFIIAILGIFIKWPRPFLLIIVPILLIILVASFFKEEANAEKRAIENLKKRY